VKARVLFVGFVVGASACAVLDGLYGNEAGQPCNEFDDCTAPESCVAPIELGNATDDAGASVTTCQPACAFDEGALRACGGGQVCVLSTGGAHCFVSCVGDPSFCGNAACVTVAIDPVSRPDEFVDVCVPE